MKKWRHHSNDTLPELANDSYLVEPLFIPPEKRLIAAILIRAAQDAVDSPGVTPDERREARAYIGIGSKEPNMGISDGTSFFSFKELCEHLELCPYTVHAELTHFYLSPSSSKKPYHIGASHPLIQYLL